MTRNIYVVEHMVAMIRIECQRAKWNDVENYFVKRNYHQFRGMKDEFMWI